MNKKKEIDEIKEEQDDIFKAVSNLTKEVKKMKGDLEDGRSKTTNKAS